MTITLVADSAIKQTYRMADIIYCDDEAYRIVHIALELAFAATLIRVKWAIEHNQEITQQAIADDFIYLFSAIIKSEYVKLIDKTIAKINNKEV